MFNKHELEIVIRKLFSDATERGFTEEEAEDMLDEISFNHLVQAIRHNAETVYAFRCDTKCEIGKDYRGMELFDQRATFLYENIHDVLYDAAIIMRSTELWLLENMSIAVVSCTTVMVGDEEVVAEYRVFKGYDWESCGIEDLEDFAEDLKTMSIMHYGYSTPFYEL